MTDWTQYVALAISGAMTIAGLLTYIVRLAQRLSVLETRLSELENNMADLEGNMGEIIDRIEEVLREIRADATEREKARDGRCELDGNRLTDILQRLSRIEATVEIVKRGLNGGK